jgi:hypothetical protein
MRKVVSRALGDAVLGAHDWTEWLHELFISRGAVGGSQLVTLARTAQLEVAPTACRRVEVDVARTTGQAVTVAVVRDEQYGGLFRIACDGEFSVHDSSGFFAVGPEEAAHEVSVTVQDILLERWWRVWPACTQHDAGLHPDFIDAGAVWLCRPGRHYTPVGELPSSPDSF